MNPTPYSEFSLRARAFLWAVIFAAAGVAVQLLIASSGSLTATLGLTGLFDILTSLVAILAITTAGLYPIRLGYKVRTTVTATLVFAAALLFLPPRAMVIAGLGAFSYRMLNVLRGKSPRVPGWVLTDIGFNTAQITLTAGVTSILFRLVGPGIDALLHLNTLVAIAAVSLAVASCFVVNSIIVSTMSALVLNSSVLSTWRATFGRGWHLSISALLLGVALAIIYLYAPIGVALVTIPLVAIHQAFSNAVAVQKQTQETLEILADTIDKRDPYTFAHSQRVSEYARLTAKRLGLSLQDQETIALAARVHDLGKIGVREELLKKPDRLTRDELEEIRRHTTIGAEIISQLADYSNSKDAVLYHHERWDGSGMYRLAYEHIPIGARIIAVADAYDAMTSDRPYRHALAPEVASAELEKGKGSQFDPVVVEAFVDAMRAVAVSRQPVVAAAEARVPLQAQPIQTRH